MELSEPQMRQCLQSLGLYFYDVSGLVEEAIAHMSCHRSTGGEFQSVIQAVAGVLAIPSTLGILQCSAVYRIASQAGK